MGFVLVFVRKGRFGRFGRDGSSSYDLLGDRCRLAIGLCYLCGTVSPVMDLFQ